MIFHIFSSSLRAISGAALLLSGAVAASAASYTVNPGAATSLAGSILQLNCNNLDVLGRVWVDSGRVSSSGNVGIAGGVLDGGSGLLEVGGSWANAGTFNASRGTVHLTGACGGDVVIVSGNNAFCNLQLASGKAYQFPAGQATTVNCRLDLGSGNQLRSSGEGEALITLGPGASVVGTAGLVNVSIVDGSPVPVPVGGFPLLLLMAAGLALAAKRVAGLTPLAGPSHEKT